MCCKVPSDHRLFDPTASLAFAVHHRHLPRRFRSEGLVYSRGALLSALEPRQRKPAAMAMATAGKREGLGHLSPALRSTAQALGKCVVNIPKTIGTRSHSLTSPLLSSLRFIVSQAPLREWEFPSSFFMRPQGMCARCVAAQRPGQAAAPLPPATLCHRRCRPSPAVVLILFIAAGGAEEWRDLPWRAA